MARTSLDIILEGVSNGTISSADAKILLEAINQKGGTNFVPVPYREINTPDWTYDPYRPGQPWYTTTGTDSTTPITNKTTTNG